MIFQGSDLDRALQTHELMADARAHAETYEHCSHQLWLWAEISRLAPQLHQEWDSPDLWPRIEPGLKVEQIRPPANRWRWALAAAASVLLAVVLLQPWHRQQRRSDFLTDQALHEVQQAEAAYARSMDRLSAVAAPRLDRAPAPLAAAYREELDVLDSAIGDLKLTVESNRYNAYLQTPLASLYREKQKTLQEWLENAKHN